MTLTLEIMQDTWLKQTAVKQADVLADGNKTQLKKGDRIALKSHEAIEEINADDSDNHVKLVLQTPLLGKYTWFAFQRHVAILDGEKLLYPAPEEDNDKAERAIATTTTSSFTGKRIILPSGTTVYTDQPIISGGHFSWGEATHGGVRIPRSGQVEGAILKLARELEEVKRVFGGATIRITSWYRPEPYNSNVGGARHSQHLSGRAVDVVIQGFSGREIAKKVLPWWKGGVGIYPGNRRHICHLDVGGKRSWGI